MQIALDAMGGDRTPKESVKGAIDFLSATEGQDVSVILVGIKDALRNELAKYTYDATRIKIAHASQIVSNNEKPARIHKTKADSSLVKAVQMVKSGEAMGVVSAGNTGALMTTSLFLLGRISGVRRPTLCPWFPTAHGGFLLCDAGANVDVRARDLVQFALMSRAYFTHLFNNPNPRIGLLSIGEEVGKGNDIVNRAYAMFKKYVKNFVGNIEANRLFEDTTDVIVCDGFIGNTILKMAEGLVKHLAYWANMKLEQHKISLFSLPLMYPALNDLRKGLDSEEHGGTPLLGINGVSVVCHGSSSAKAFMNGLLAARDCVNNNLIEAIKNGIGEHLDLFEDDQNIDKP